MDILLSNPYSLADDPHERAVMKPYPPLGVLYLSSHLKAQGFEVGVHDSTFSEPGNFARQVARDQPPVIGIAANLMTRQAALAQIRIAQESGAFVILGGPEPVNYAAEYLDRGADVIVAGEGEVTTADLLDRRRAGRLNLAEVPGILYRDGDQIVRTADRPLIADLNGQPYPDRAAIDLPRYLATWRAAHSTAPVSLITARGCPYRCSWCSHSVFGYTHRRRTPANVADEVAAIVGDYAPDALWYADDVFTIHHRWLARYADELEARGLRLPFETISREDRLNDTAIALLARLGCSRIWIGAESGSQRILDRMERRTRAARVRTLTHQLQDAGIEVGLFIMLGYDGEDSSDLQATVDHLKDANPDIFLTTVAYPIRGTPYANRLGDRLQPADFDTKNDREAVIRGRHSRRYYAFATRWMVNEVALGHARGVGRAKALINAGIGKIGMALTSREVEA